MLELLGVATQAGDFRLEEIRLQVAAGCCHAVLGPSGSGKSLLLRTVLGVQAPTAGRVRLEGRDLAALPVERRGLGYVPQHLALFPHLTLRQNVEFGLRAQGRVRRGDQEYLDSLVEATGIGPLLDRRPDTLSGGERQRAALVRALAPRPRAILLDEPFAALDTSLRRELGLLLLELRRREGLTVLLVTHDLDEAYLLSDQVSVLVAGVQAQSGEKAAVFQRPASLAVARFLGLRNHVEARVLKLTPEGFAVDCPALGGRLLLGPGQGSAGAPAPAPGDALWLGIRPEWVALRDEAHPARPDERLLEGPAQIAELGSDLLVRVRDAASGLRLDVVVPRRQARRFGLPEHPERVRLGVDPRLLYWMPAEKDPRESVGTTEIHENKASC